MLSYLSIFAIKNGERLGYMGDGFEHISLILLSSGEKPQTFDGLGWLKSLHFNVGDGRGGGG